MNTIKITGLSHDGSGVGRLDGKVIFVPNTLPEETVAVEIGATKKGVTFGTCTEIIEANPHRRTPPCPLAEQCGGCALQIADDTLQGKLKEQQVRDALTRIGKLDLDVLPIKTMAHPWRYRNKGIFHVDETRGMAQLGFYEKNSHTLVPAKDCLLFSQQVSQLVAWIEEAITNSGIAGNIDKVMIRESHLTGEMMVVFVTSEQKFRHQKMVDALKEEWPAVVSIWQNINTNPRLMLGRAYNLLAGEETIREQLGTLTYALSPASFFQVNTEQAEVLYQCGKDVLNLQGNEAILDLYCGIGTIGSFMAQKNQHLIGVDSVSQAIDDAKEAAHKNGFINAHFYTAKAEVWLPNWQKKGGKADIAIIDPPRKGCDTRLLDTLITANIPKILYISCNPATLARDLKHLSNHYTISAVQPVDLFPQTSHVETVALLSKLDVDKHISVEIELDELDLTSAESKATYAQIKEYILEKFNLKVSTLYIAQIKRKCGIELREHYNKSKKEKQVIRQCTPEKEEAIMDALRHFKMI